MKMNLGNEWNLTNIAGLGYELSILILVLLGNFVFAIIYLIINLCRKGINRPGTVMRFAVVLLCPIVAPLFFAISHIMFKLFFRQPVSLTDVIFSKERVKTYVRAEEDWERNIVPIEEAISVTEKGDLRNFMMSVVRGDIQKSLSSIMLALNSEDSETSHYAAAVLQDELNIFRDNVENDYCAIMNDAASLTEDGSEHPEVVDKKAEVGQILIEYMNVVLEQKVFADMEQQEFVDKMDDVAEYIYTHKPGALSSSSLEAVALRAMEIEEFELCSKWCDRAVEMYPNTLATYTARLKMYFTTGDRDSFRETMEELKHSSVVIDSATMELIRVFQ